MAVRGQLAELMNKVILMWSWNLTRARLSFHNFFPLLNEHLDAPDSSLVLLALVWASCLLVMDFRVSFRDSYSNSIYKLITNLAF